MEYIKIDNNEYGYVVNYKDNAELRCSFNNLVKTTFGFDFEDWYQNGYWKDGYIPYSLLDGNKVISNVSVSIMDFLIQGEKKKFIQIGTVMTDKAYRNKGLNRFLMEKVLEDWKDRCDLIYLFANDSVVDFYPKFGFTTVNEYQHSKEIITENLASNVRQLNMSDEKDIKFLFDRVSKSLPCSQFAMMGNASLIMFYCTSFMSQNVYYIKSLDTIAIADFDEDVLYLNDVFCLRDVLIDDVITAMVNKSIKQVVLGFTPKDTTTFDVTLLKEEDTTLFVLEDKVDIFNDNKIMFPLLSHT